MLKKGTCRDRTGDLRICNKSLILKQIMKNKINKYFYIVSQLKLKRNLPGSNRRPQDLQSYAIPLSQGSNITNTKKQNQPFQTNKTFIKYTLKDKLLILKQIMKNKTKQINISTQLANQNQKGTCRDRTGDSGFAVLRYTTKLRFQYNKYKKIKLTLLNKQKFWKKNIRSRLINISYNNKFSIQFSFIKEARFKQKIMNYQKKL
ncbi:hypothetical protein TTHERM_000120879 (macronuclear) [Tetrahymena thermophila SB210]|uniref:Uncharacterized protein n=1 Tax=Tetrahymena thermophila (strain SB210) TaxID=312017 RepID=W7XFZ2_TETTS|nr:hypothetical protein TTHERM_000120879 [Tetrahymena thermophila SB210]EWS75793.1 hypothetical protein TTHERM_000120879 [Tetrahymena thermophila SB210]|eukprot:XP_012651715.1 hypothetical protein TTHERM_000120879 [Tetrahymena thermophila SB210]